MNIWLYNINPKSPQAYRYGWDVDEPKTLLKSGDKEWGTTAPRQVQVGDMVCVYMKNLKGKPDGVYVVGFVTEVNVGARTFTWRVDKARTLQTLVIPIEKEAVAKHFGRGFGAPMRRIKHNRTAWLARVATGGSREGGRPIAKATKKPSKAKAEACWNPKASKENGLKGEKYVLRLLRKRYPAKNGFQVVHVAADSPSADHDIAVMRAGKCELYVEVKTRVGAPGDRVIISENELKCRKRNKGKHAIFIVYLAASKKVHSTIEIGSTDAFELSPRQHFLIPGTA